MTLQEIHDAAQDLPVVECARLIHALWDTVSSDDWVPPSNDWINESQRRSEAYDAGQMAAAPWSEVRQRARRQTGLND